MHEQRPPRGHVLHEPRGRGGADHVRVRRVEAQPEEEHARAPEPGAEGLRLERRLVAVGVDAAPPQVRLVAEDRDRGAGAPRRPDEPSHRVLLRPVDGPRHEHLGGVRHGRVGRRALVGHVDRRGDHRAGGPVLRAVVLGGVLAVHDHRRRLPHDAPLEEPPPAAARRASTRSPPRGRTPSRRAAGPTGAPRSRRRSARSRRRPRTGSSACLRGAPPPRPGGRRSPPAARSRRPPRPRAAAPAAGAACGTSGSAPGSTSGPPACTRPGQLAVGEHLEARVVEAAQQAVEDHGRAARRGRGERVDQQQPRLRHRTSRRRPSGRSGRVRAGRSRGARGRAGARPSWPRGSPCRRPGRRCRWPRRRSPRRSSPRP